MTTLFGGWEPTIIPQPPIIIPQEIPPQPVISVSSPVLDNPTHITSTRRLSTATGDKMFASQISDVGLAYALKDNQIIGTLTLTDHSCNDKAGLIRVYPGGHMDKLVVDRAELLRGKYSPGVAAGIVHTGSSKIDVVELRNLNYERLYPITSAGDIYAGILTAGGKDLDQSGDISILDLLIENVRCRNTVVDYTGSSVGKYPNSDGIILEKTVKRARLNGGDFAFGSDAGFDCKCQDARIENWLFNEFRESMKFWASGQDGNVYSAAPKVAHYVLPTGGKIVERVVDFAAFNCPDPTKPIVQFQAQPHKLILQKGYLECDFANQVLATADSGAIGATVQMGDKSITISKQVTMLSELLS